MRFRGRLRSSRREERLAVVLSVLAAVVVFAATINAAPAEESVTKYFVDVPVASLDRAGELQAAGFDIAGVNQGESTVGIVATAADLDRLVRLGYTYSVRSTNKDAASIAALSDYTDPQELSAFETALVNSYPNLVRKITLRDTLFEGQQLYAVKITKDVNQDNERPTFILDAQHHAREVMTAEIAKDMMNYLTSRYATDPQVQRWVDNVNIYIVGSVNPDGAMYVFTSDNMWRKNRHPSCPVDVNRNYPFMWGSCNGSSGNCSDDTMRGLSAGSEPETQGMIQLISDVHPFYTLSYHSYGEYIMYSYGCTNPDEMAALGQRATALNGMLQNDNGVVNGYRVGPIWSTIYQVDGGSIDSQYALYSAYGYTIEVNSSSFQPDYATWRDITVQRQRVAWQYFLDQTLDGPQIRGKVTDVATGLPLAAQLSMQEVTYTHGEAPRTADAKGNYQLLTQNDRTYHVTYSAPMYCPVTRTVAVGAGPATQDVALAQPAAPLGVSAVGAGDNQIDVSWASVPDATQYRVLRSLTPGGPYTEVGLVAAPSTVFHDATVSGVVTYYYVVRTVLPLCESANSAEASASTTGTCSFNPLFGGVTSVTNAEQSTCGLTVKWSAASLRCGGVATYEVHRSTTTPFTPSSSNLVASGLGGTQYTDHSGLGNGTTYYYIVRAVDSANGLQDDNTVIMSNLPTGPYAPGTFTDDAGDTGSAKLTGQAPWWISPSGGKTAPKVYMTGTYSNSLCSSLTSPVIRLQTGAVLSFASKYDIETGYDAGEVEVAQGPNFTTWTRLSTVNYPDPLANGGNACGFSTSTTNTVFSRTNATPTYPSSNYSGSLSAYNNKEIKLRWRISSDGLLTGTGWWVDDVTVTNAMLQTVCSSGLAPNPKEVSPAGAPMTALRARTGTGVVLTYTPGCGTLDNAVYWGAGQITGAPVWTSAACALGNTGQASFDPGTPSPGGLFYFVIVGQNATKEGSYGQSFNGASYAERPEAVGVGTCDKAQDLTGTCP